MRLLAVGAAINPGSVAPGPVAPVAPVARWRRDRPRTAAPPFGRLNRRIYSPLCLALAAGLTAALIG
jgi:hypothetical protein